MQKKSWFWSRSCLDQSLLETLLCNRHAEQGYSRTGGWDQLGMFDPPDRAEWRRADCV